MGVKQVKEVPFSLHCEAIIGPDGKALYHWHDKWQVIVDDIHDFDEVAIAKAGGDLPVLGLDHPSYAGLLRCVKINARRSDECPTLFDVDIEWATVRATDTTWSVKIESDHVEREYDVFWLTGADGAAYPLTNSLGAQFDPTIKGSIYDEEITISFNVQALDGDALSHKRGMVNSDTVTIPAFYGQATRTFDPFTVKLARARYSTVWGDGLPYWRVWICLHINLEVDETDALIGWKRRIADRGYVAVLYPPVDVSGVSDYEPDYTVKPDIVAPGTENAIQDHFYLDGAGHLLDVWADPAHPPKVKFFTMLPPTAALNSLVAGLAPTTGVPEL